MDNNMNNDMVSLQKPNQENQVYVQEEKDGITLGQIWHMLMKHWIALVICALIGLACGVGYAKLIKTPKYQSSVQLMVSDESDEVMTTSSNLSLAVQKTSIAATYMTTDEVLEKVGFKLTELKYDVYAKDANGQTTTNYDYTAIKKLYSVTIPSITNGSTSVFINVTTTCKTEQMAIDLANIVSESTIELVNTQGTIGYKNLRNCLTSLGRATTASDTSTSTFVISLVGILIGLVVGAAYGIIREMCNTKVTSKGDLEELTGCKVIGMIPKYDTYPSISEYKGGKENA